MVEEDARHRFITCLVAKAVCMIISQIWASITGNILSPYKWVFMEEVKAMPTPSYKVVFVTPMLYGDVVPRGDGLMSSSFTTLERVSLALSLFMT